MEGKAEDRNFSKADEVRVFPKGKLELMTIGGATIGRATLEPGDVSVLPSGHDAWVVGNENVVVVDFQGMKDYAKKAA